MAPRSLNATLIVPSLDKGGASTCASPKSSSFAPPSFTRILARASFALESVGVLGSEALDRDDPTDPRVAGLPHLPHAAGTQRHR